MINTSQQQHQILLSYFSLKSHVVKCSLYYHYEQINCVKRLRIVFIVNLEKKLSRCLLRIGCSSEFASQPSPLTTSDPRCSGWSIFGFRSSVYFASSPLSQRSNGPFHWTSTGLLGLFGNIFLSVIYEDSGRSNWILHRKLKCLRDVIQKKKRDLSNRIKNTSIS